MKIAVNGESCEVGEGITIAGLLEMLGLKGRPLAVEVNMQIISRSKYDIHYLQSGDRVEVVQAMGGG